MALRLTRKEGEGFVITLEPDTSEAELRELIEHGITVSVHDLSRGKVKVAVDAPDAVRVLRSELVG